MTFPTGVDFRKYSDKELTTMLEEAGEASKHARKLGRVMGVVAAHRLKQIRELLMYEELAIWRRENGFDRVAEGEESCFPGHRSLPPTPQEYYASLWCEVNALKEAISMPARTPWQKTAEFVDGFKGKLQDWELAEIKRYVEKRCREEAQAQMTAKPVGTVQHCSPISPNPDTPSDVCFNLENEGRMVLELGNLKSSSAVTGLNTPGQQCPPNEGIRETDKNYRLWHLARRRGSKPRRKYFKHGTSDKDGNGCRHLFDSCYPVKTKAQDIQRRKKQFDPGGRGEKAPPWNAAVPLPFFFWGEAGRLLVCLPGAKLGGFLSVLSMPCLCVCFSKIVFLQVKLISKTFSRDADKSLMYATGGHAFSRLLPYLKMARTSNARFDRSANALE